MFEKIKHFRYVLPNTITIYIQIPSTYWSRSPVLSFFQYRRQESEKTIISYFLFQ
ncbi:hypothetical protein Hanom_Chr06g00565531 [Helianthus anomalus]